MNTIFLVAKDSGLTSNSRNMTEIMMDDSAAVGTKDNAGKSVAQTIISKTAPRSVDMRDRPPAATLTAVRENDAVTGKPYIATLCACKTHVKSGSQ